ncbi:unnamed protein product [Closterium sp. NIES-65]|nr:unnamed protein product [Closterium sp. NIES-65]
MASALAPAALLQSAFLGKDLRRGFAGISVRPASLGLRAWSCGSQRVVGASSRQRSTSAAPPSKKSGMAAAASASAVTAAAEGASVDAIEKTLLIVGAGTLGSLVAQQWQQRFPGAKVYGQTRSDTRHEQLRSMGVFPILRDVSDDAITGGVPFVIFCAPLGGSQDYEGDVRAAAALWNGTGAFLFTSSSAVYAVSDNSFCPEGAPTVPLGASPRVDVLLKAEGAALEAGGNVVRLAGLYTLERGAHTYWLRQGTVDQRPDHILNLISYEDAASLSATILAARPRGQIFMGCDNHPLSRQELMDLTVRSGRFEGEFKGFTGTEGPLGKRMCNDATRAALGWEPTHKSFAHFLGLESLHAPRHNPMPTQGVAEVGWPHGEEEGGAARAKGQGEGGVGGVPRRGGGDGMGRREGIPYLRALLL